MKFKKIDGGFMIRLEQGEEIMEKITSFAVEKEIPAGVISGLGAVDKIRVGYFEIKSGTYPEKTFTGNLEILSLTGNISWTGEKPVPHLHIMFSDEKLHAYGGHLLEGRVSVTCELFLRTFSQRLERRLDPQTGLKLLDLQ